MDREIAHLPMNPTLKGQAELIQHIRYSANGQELSLILPWAPHGDRSGADRIPLLVFVQGSGWTKPNLDYEIPMLSHFAEEGIAVATVSHRNAREGHPFPAFLKDVKCAVRFLRAHAAEYAIDPDRVAAFGTSSGGNAVCLLGVTGDDPELKTEEYADRSDAVCGVVSCCAPADLPSLFADRSVFPDHQAVMTDFFGRDPDRWEEEMRRYSPIYRVEAGKDYPPFLLLHGTCDPIVPCSQMEQMYRKLKEAGADADAFYVDGAEHGWNFWSPEVREVIHRAVLRFLNM